MPSKSIEKMGWKSIAGKGEFGIFTDGKWIAKFQPFVGMWDVFWPRLQPVSTLGLFSTLRAAIAATKAAK